jgi:hypothetical protein
MWVRAHLVFDGGHDMNKFMIGGWTRDNVILFRSPKVLICEI